MAKDSNPPSIRVFSTVSRREFPELYGDLFKRPNESWGKRLAYLAHLGLYVDSALARGDAESFKAFLCQGESSLTSPFPASSEKPLDGLKDNMEPRLQEEREPPPPKRRSVRFSLD